MDCTYETGSSCTKAENNRVRSLRKSGIESHAFNFDHVEFKMYLKHPGGNVKYAFGYRNLKHS